MIITKKPKMKIKLLIFLIAFYGTAYSQFTKIHDFIESSNGIIPVDSLVSDGTFLYGMTQQDGTNGLGTLFKIMPDGTGFIKLLDFAGITNGAYPDGSLFFDGTFLYGMTEYGGTNNKGTLFKIMPNGMGFTKLLDFTGVTNGSFPRGSIISDGTYIYGLTYRGGTNDFGTLFKIMPNGTGYIKLLDFAGLTNGSNPNDSLFFDGSFLYGMTENGGSNNKGTLFKIMSNGMGYAKLLDFTGVTNGSFPLGSIISDGTFLYGMTHNGGLYDSGTIFKILTDGTGYLKLYDFDGTINGGYPRGSLLLVGSFLYGMANTGGENLAGVLFKIMTNGTGYLKLVNFANDNNGCNPFGSLLSHNNFLYGMLPTCGPYNSGTLFKYQDNTLSLEENDEEIVFTISPNPILETTTLHTNIFLNDAILTVYNLSGQQVKKLENISGETITIHRENLTNGIYLICLTQNGKIIAKKKLVVLD